jgi:hypothetical protein
MEHPQTRRRQCCRVSSKENPNLLPLTISNPELDCLVRRTPREGMMFWSGTSADPAATCGGCQHFGFTAVIRDGAGNALTTRKHPTCCALFKKYARRPGVPLDPKTPGCRYHEVRQS